MWLAIKIKIPFSAVHLDSNKEKENMTKFLCTDNSSQ